MKKVQLAMYLGEVVFETEDGKKEKVELPDGCVGIMLAFKTKKAARAYYGKDIELQPAHVDEGV